MVDVSDAHSLWHNTGTTVVGAQGNCTVTVRTVARWKVAA